MTTDNDPIIEAKNELGDLILAKCKELSVKFGVKVHAASVVFHADASHGMVDPEVFTTFGPYSLGLLQCSIIMSEAAATNMVMDHGPASTH
jgi:hypothetical protein